MKIMIIILSIFTLASACGTTIPAGELSSTTIAEYKSDSGRRSFPSLQQRAKFDLECDTLQYESLSATFVLDGTWQNGAQIGTTGCGRRAVYIMTDSGWVMNSVDGQPK